MATSTAELLIACKTSGADKIDKVNKSLLGLDGIASKVLGGLAAYFSARTIIGFAKDSIKAFSDLQEASQKFNEVFKGVEEMAQKEAQILQEKFGASERSAKDMLALSGDLLTGFGFSRKEALELSSRVAQLGSDVASFSNYAGGAEGATIAITKAMLGETEMAKMLGIAIKTDSQEYKELYKQIKRTRGTTDSQTKALAALEIAFRQKGNAMGDFERNIGSIANQSRLFNNRIEDLKTSVGEFLNKTFNVALGINKIGSGIGNLSDMIKKHSTDWAWALNNEFLAIEAIAKKIWITLKYLLKPIIEFFTIVGKNFGTLVTWMAENWDGIFSSETLDAAGRDILQFYKNLANALISVYSYLGKALKTAIIEGLKGNDVGKALQELTDSVFMDVLKVVSDYGRETQIAMTRQGVKPLKLEDAFDIKSGWGGEFARQFTRELAIVDVEFDRKIRELDARMREVKEQERQAEDQVSDTTKPFDLSQFSKFMNQYKQTAINATGVNSQQSAMLQSRQTLFMGDEARRIAEQTNVAKQSLAAQRRLVLDVSKIAGRIASFDADATMHALGFSTYTNTRYLN